MSKGKVAAIVTAAVVAVGAAVCVGVKCHRKHWEGHREHDRKADGRGDALLRAVYPEPKVRDDFWQAVVVLAPEKDWTATTVALRLASGDHLRNVVKRPEVYALLGKTGEEAVKVLRSHTRIRIENRPDGRVVSLGVGGMAKASDAVCLAMLFTNVFINSEEEFWSARRRVAVQLADMAVKAAVEQRNGLLREADEIRRESAVPQLQERRAMVSGRQQEAQARMLQLDMKIEECSRALETLAKARESHDLFTLPELSARVEASEEMRGIESAMAKLRLEKAEAGAEGDSAKARVQALEKRLAALAALRAESARTLSATMLAEMEQSLRTQLGNLRSERTKVQQIYTLDLATSRDLVERMARLERLEKEIARADQTIAKSEDQMREWIPAEKAGERPAWVVGVFEVQHGRVKPLPLESPVTRPASRPASRPGSRPMVRFAD